MTALNGTLGNSSLIGKSSDIIRRQRSLLRLGGKSSGVLSNASDNAWQAVLPVLVVLSRRLVLGAAGMGLVFLTLLSGRLTYAQGPGRWLLGPNSQALAVNASVLKNGKVLYFGGSQHDPYKPWGIDATYIYDPADDTVTKITSPSTDIFCSGQAQLADGRIAVVGGTESYPLDLAANDIHGEMGHFTGTRTTWIFDPSDNSWSAGPDLNHEPGKSTGGGRWYPSVIMLHNGTLLAVAGHPSDADSRHDNTSPEIWSGLTGDPWRFLSASDDKNWLGYYPRCFLLPDGRIFFATPVQGSSQATKAMTPSTPARWEYVTGPLQEFVTAVLLPLTARNNYEASVLALGGRDSWRIDPMRATHVWYTTSKRTLADSPVRLDSNAVILPTGEILLSGGVRPDPMGMPGKFDRNPVNQAEIYNPDTDTWYVGAAARITRNYHSVALLLPDGRVWTAGSNKNAGYSKTGQLDGEGRELNMELYEPWYYGRPDRPKIIGAPTSIYPGQTFTIITDRSISKVALVRLGSVTHTVNFDQRHIWLQASSTLLETKPTENIWLESSSSISPGTRWRTLCTAPPNNVVAPPGYYMVFALNSSGVPSKAKFIRVEDSSAIRRVTTANRRGYFMYIDDPLANNTPGANVLVTPNWNSPGSPEYPRYSPNPIGVWYDPSAGKYSIFDETRADMELGTAFNVKIEPPSVSLNRRDQGAPRTHIATEANTAANFTNIDDPELNGKPDAVIIVTHNWGAPREPRTIYNPHNIGVWYNSGAGKWSIFNEDMEPMPVGVTFSYHVGGGAFVHTATASNIASVSTYIDHPRLNGRSNAAILVTHNWNPGNSRFPGKYNDSAVGTWYDAGRGYWAIFNQRNRAVFDRLYARRCSL